MYLDDIIIWSSSIEEHLKHIREVMNMLRKNRLYCNTKKSEFFLFELTFLGHKISQKGIEACTSKIDCIMKWLVPKSATDVRAFLGPVRYIAAFLPKLAKFTVVLNGLTTKV